MLKDAGSILNDMVEAADPAGSVRARIAAGRKLLTDFKAIADERSITSEIADRSLILTVARARICVYVDDGSGEVQVWRNNEGQNKQVVPLRFSRTENAFTGIESWRDTSGAERWEPAINVLADVVASFGAPPTRSFHVAGL